MKCTQCEAWAKECAELKIENQRLRHELAVVEQEVLGKAAAWLKTPIPAEESERYGDYEGRLLARAADRMLMELVVRKEAGKI